MSLCGDSRVQGRHLRHKGLKDINALSEGDQFQAVLMNIPCLQGRVEAMIFARTFRGDLALVGVWGCGLVCMML